MTLMLSDWVWVGVNLALVAVVLLMVPVSYALVRGPTAADRLQSLELLFTLLIGVIVLLAVVKNAPLFLDLGIALAAFSFIATVAIARYLSDGQVF